MQLTVSVAALTALIALLFSNPQRSFLVGFCSVVLFHLLIHIGPKWMSFSEISRLLGFFLNRLSRDPASTAPAMLAAGFTGWILAIWFRSAFVERHRTDWDPDAPKPLRRAR
jgi:hypothetical protein